MDLDLLVRLMQMEMVTNTYAQKPRDRGVLKSPDFALILAAALEGQKAGGVNRAPRQAVPPVKGAKKPAAPPGTGSAHSGAGKGGARVKKGVSASGLEEMVDRVAGKHGIDPALLRAVVKVESDFDPTVVSSAGAMGLMQLMPGTASLMGVKNPFDPLENLEGGARYLKSMIERFNGDMKLALAAYNAGPGAVERYGGVPPYKETISYLKKINDILNSY